MCTILDIIPLGVGRGADAVFHGRCSSSLLLVHHEQPVLLVDAGYGVVREFRKHFSEITCPIYVSHNHSDHAAELPIIGPVMSSGGVRLPLLAESGVMERIRDRRLHELVSTGKPLEHFFDYRALEENTRFRLGDAFEVMPLQGTHSERSFGLMIFEDGKELLAISGDSRFDEAYYAQLSKASNVVLDGREAGSMEHAAFADLERWSREHPELRVWVTGFGETDYSPGHFSLCRPGERIALS